MIKKRKITNSTGVRNTPRLFRRLSGRGWLSKMLPVFGPNWRLLYNIVITRTTIIVLLQYIIVVCSRSANFVRANTTLYHSTHNTTVYRYGPQRDDCNRVYLYTHSEWLVQVLRPRSVRDDNLTSVYYEHMPAAAGVRGVTRGWTNTVAVSRMSPVSCAGETSAAAGKASQLSSVTM